MLSNECYGKLKKKDVQRMYAEAKKEELQTALMTAKANCVNMQQITRLLFQFAASD